MGEPEPIADPDLDRLPPAPIEQETRSHVSLATAKADEVAVSATLPPPRPRVAAAPERSGAVGGRRRAAIHTETVDAEDIERFARALQRVQERPREIRTPAQGIDWARVAAAKRAERHAPPAEIKRPVRAALSPDPCARCGIPGRRGCAHQAPYEGAPLPVIGDPVDRRVREQRKGRGGL